MTLASHLVSDPVLALFIPGHPRPKGSMQAQMVRDGAGRLTGKVRMVESSPESSSWRRTMALAMHREVVRLGVVDGDSEDSRLLGGPCVVSCTFWFDYPSQAARGTRWPTHKHVGDIDKLLRNVLDAMTDARVYADDRQVVSVVETLKLWVPDAPGARAGAHVRVWRV